MVTFTSSLSESTLEKLTVLAKEMKVPKNRIIQKALDHYLRELDKALYKKSLQQYSEDPDIFSIAEEGLVDYLSQSDLLNETR